MWLGLGTVGSCLPTWCVGGWAGVYTHSPEPSGCFGDGHNSHAPMLWSRGAVLKAL